MGTLLDAFALVAFLGGEPAAPDVRDILRTGDAAISTVNLAEAGQHLIRHGDVSGDELRQLVGSIPLEVIPFTGAHAWRASELRARHYRRTDSEVSLADCCLVAVATAADRVATADAAVIRMAVAESIETLALPRP
jgi:PIN domain nuclease of toxin-antitoxin system